MGKRSDNDFLQKILNNSSSDKTASENDFKIHVNVGHEVSWPVNDSFIVYSRKTTIINFTQIKITINGPILDGKINASEFFKRSFP